MKSYVKTLLLLARRVRVALARLLADMQHLAGLLALLMALLAAGVHAQQPPAVPTLPPIPAPWVECVPVAHAVRGAGYRIGHTYRLDYRARPYVYVVEEPQQIVLGDCTPEVATPAGSIPAWCLPAMATPGVRPYSPCDGVDAHGVSCRTWHGKGSPNNPEGWCPTPTVRKEP